MFYTRRLLDDLQAHLEKPYVTVLTGMRRTGKTTLVKHLLETSDNKNSLYLDLQRVDNRELFSIKNYDAIRDALLSRGLLANKPMIVALDELQLAPESIGAIKYLYDHYRIKFIVSGSSSYYLKNLFSDSLAGRKKVFELFPLDFGEFLEFKGISHKKNDWLKMRFDLLEYNRLKLYYEEFIRFGGFPEVVLATNLDEKKDLLLDIITSYINTDIRSLADFTDERNLYTLVKLLAGRVGSKLDYSKLSRLTGISRPTVTNYISFLEKTYCIIRIPVFTRNPDREIVKAQKLYFCDTGLANVLGEIGSGAQFENTLYNQLAHLGEVKYYALKNGQEIDFVFDKKFAFEAKETPTSDDLLTLSRISVTAGIPAHRLIGRHVSPKFEDYIWGGSIY